MTYRPATTKNAIAMRIISTSTGPSYQVPVLLPIHQTMPSVSVL